MGNLKSTLTGKPKNGAAKIDDKSTGDAEFYDSLSQKKNAEARKSGNAPQPSGQTDGSKADARLGR